MCLDKKQCIYESKCVKQSLIDADFLINEEKSVFEKGTSTIEPEVNNSLIDLVRNS
jgi:hypothetical protein